MSRAKKIAPLHSKVDRKRSPVAKRTEVDEARREAVRRVLAGRDIAPDTLRIIENTAVKYSRALKRLADR
jgi:hypothetical protein